jgi:PEP-CTERM motif
MRSHTLSAKTLTLAALFAAFVSSAHLQAATISFSNPIPASDAAGHSSLPTSASFSLSEFNPALGTLTGVQISFGLTYAGELDVINFTNASNPFTSGMSQVPINVLTPSGLDSPLVTTAYAVASGIANPPQFATTFFMGPPTATSPSFTPGAGDFALYTGLGNNSYTLSYGTGSYSGTGVGVGFGGDASSSGTATVTYTYTPTPEPSTLVLLALGTLALAATSRRSRFRTRAV